MVRNDEGCRGPALHYECRDDRVFGIGIRVDIRTRRTRALAEEGDAVRVTAESCNVVADPFNGEALVLQSDILGAAREAGEAEDINTVAGK